MEEKLMELPFGDKFKKYWLEHVKFMNDNKRNTSISAQNYCLTRYHRDFTTEQEAIDFLLSIQETVIKYINYSGL